jgi:hypothetical protein
VCVAGRGGIQGTRILGGETLSRAPEVLSRIEELGGFIALDRDGSIRYRVPKDSVEARVLLETAKTERGALLAYLRVRQAAQVFSAPPAGIRLIECRLKEPPVAIETYSLVFDPVLFANTTMEQLRLALGSPKRWVGWTVSQLIERLAQVGVTVEFENGFARESER